MNTRRILMALALFLTILVPFSAAIAQTNPLQNIPVVGSLPGGGTFNGTLDVTRFVVQNGQLAAVGTLSGTLTNAAGAVIGTVSNVLVTLPLSATGSCQVLDLTLGPLDLNLLGLMVHLNQIHLQITAQSGSGNLLGNLLCAVAHLLDSNGSNSAIAGLLNQILKAL